MQQQLEQSDLKEQTLPYLATKPRSKILLASLIPSTSSLFHFFISLSHFIIEFPSPIPCCHVYNLLHSPSTTSSLLITAFFLLLSYTQTSPFPLFFFLLWYIYVKGPSASQLLSRNNHNKPFCLMDFCPTYIHQIELIVC